MAEQHRPALEVWTGSRHARALFISRQIDSAIRLEGDWMGLRKSPGWRTIAKALETLAL
ncbi:hypothetical protein D3C86_2132080 [compost metagenome]